MLVFIVVTVLGIRQVFQWEICLGRGPPITSLIHEKYNDQLSGLRARHSQRRYHK